MAFLLTVLSKELMVSEVEALACRFKAVFYFIHIENHKVLQQFGC